MQLTSSAPAPDSPIIRTGSDGRLRYSPEQRQTLLDAFDRGGQSALAFSKHHGVCYQSKKVRPLENPLAALVDRA